jgi:hypothetical protein
VACLACRAGSIARVGLTSFAVLAIGACSDASSKEPLARTSSAIIGGRDSGPDEDATVRVYARPPQLDAGLTDLYCSGYLLAPNLVVTARHCVLMESEADTRNFNCNPNGTLADPTDPSGTQTTLLPASNVTVYVGDDAASLTALSVSQILTEDQVGICNSDIAFLVLTEPAMDVHAVLQAGLVSVGQTFSLTGWGYTSDKAASMGRSALPSTRRTLDEIVVNGVGPGLMPADSFSSPGATGCFGDSGAAARIGNTVIGVFSRLDGPLSTYNDGLISCEVEQGANYYTMIGAHLDLVQTAFASAGWTPIFECGAAGKGCATGEQCDTATGACVALDAGSDSSAPPAPSAKAPPPSQATSPAGACTLVDHSAPGASLAYALGGLALLLGARRWRSHVRS